MCKMGLGVLVGMSIWGISLKTTQDTPVLWEKTPSERV